MTNRRRDFVKPKKGGRNMMHYLNTLLALIFCVLMTNSSVQAEQIGAPQKVSPAIQSSPSTSRNIAPMPLQGPLPIMHVAPLCNSIPNTANAIMQKYLDLRQALDPSGITFSGFASEMSQIHTFGASVQQYCCSPGISFSVQQQQAAGCAGSDTVQVCMDKLTKQCIRDEIQERHIRDKAQKIKDVSMNASDKMRQLAQETQKLLTSLP